jgi:integrase
MAFIEDAQELKPGLVIFRRGDVAHRRWYCRVKMPKEDRYKTISLKTADIDAAKERAYEQDAEIRYRIKLEVPVFDKSFAQVAKEFLDFTKARMEAGEITKHRYRVLESHIRCQINPFIGTTQITLIAEESWKKYPAHRQSTGKGRSGGRVSEGTIRDEMATFRSVMAWAATKRYIRESQVFKGKLPLSKQRREEFTPQEYRDLHTFARNTWIKAARTSHNLWYRKMAYEFMLVMTNTGMRPSEARNLRWRDVEIKKEIIKVKAEAKQQENNAQDKESAKTAPVAKGQKPVAPADAKPAEIQEFERTFVILNVRGKGKFRSLVAPSDVVKYLERIRALSKATGPDDFVFSNHQGTSSLSLYHDVLERLLIDSELLMSSSGKRRSTYCFRHTYATYRLMEGVDVYFLAKQMGTSVKMIEDHYGHITPVKNAERILQGMPGWAPVAVEAGNKAGSVNADGPGDEPATS